MKSGPGNPKLNSALDLVKSEIVRIVGGDVRLFLFGSYARGDARDDSDVDLMVVVPDALYNPNLKNAVMDAVHDITFDTEFLFSLLIVSESLAARFKGFKVFASVEKEGLQV